MTESESELFGTYSPYICDREAFWWIRDDGCSAVEAGVIRPRSIRRGIVKLARAQGALCWYSNFIEDWSPLEDSTAWHWRVEFFAGYTAGIGNGHGELLVCRPDLDPNNADALRRAFVMFDTAAVSDVFLWAVQPETDPCAWAFVAPSWVEPIRALLRTIARKEVVREYRRLRRYLRFCERIEHIVNRDWSAP
jgi:hypothetical protein